MVSRNDDPAKRLNLFLAILGVVAIAIAGIGLLLNRNEVLAGGFLVVGALFCILAVVAPRLEGQQEMSLTGAKWKLAKLQQKIEAGEAEMKTHQLPTIEDAI